MSFILAKRPREEDGFGGFVDRALKRSCFDRSSSFSFNPSLPVQFPLSPPFRPTEPVAENTTHAVLPEETVPEPFRQWREERKNSVSLLNRRPPPTLTLDTAMDVDVAQPSPLPNGDNLSPWPVGVKSKASNHLQPSPIPHHLLSQSLTISGGRTSTPIHSHFTLNMHPEMMASPSQSTHNLKPEDESSWWRRRRLPSPISEAGGVETLLTLGEGEGEEITDGNERMDYPDSPSSMDVDGDIPSNTFLQVPEQKIEETAAYLPKSAKSEPNLLATERARTVAPDPETLAVRRRQKISFSMGYRADCEKCQMRVPGHYSHIVRS